MSTLFSNFRDFLSDCLKVFLSGHWEPEF